jgi:thiol-disulfide isomerase/thioredoxin
MKFTLPFIAVLLLAGCYAKNPEKTGHEGETIPSFTLLLSDSTTYFNTKNIPKGKSVVLFYFGSHCAFSQAQMKEIIEDIDKLKNLEIYAFTTDSFNDMREFGKQFSIETYPNIHLGQDYTRFFGDYFEVVGVPYIAVYGKDKTLNKAFMGKVYSSQIRKSAED